MELLIFRKLNQCNIFNVHIILHWEMTRFISFPLFIGNEINIYNFSFNWIYCLCYGSLGWFSSESPEISCHTACIVLCAFSYHEDHDNQDIALFFWLDFESLMCGNQNITMKLKSTDRSELFIVWNTQFIESNQTVWLKFHLNVFMVCNTVIL